MGRRKKQQLTQEQIDWRNRVSPERPEVVLTEDDKIKKCIFYLNNCIHWINEYTEGRTDKKDLLGTAISIQRNAKELENLLKVTQ